MLIQLPYISGYLFRGVLIETIIRHNYTAPDVNYGLGKLWVRKRCRCRICQKCVYVPRQARALLVWSLSSVLLGLISWDWSTYSTEYEAAPIWSTVKSSSLHVGTPDGLLHLRRHSNHFVRPHHPSPLPPLSHSTLHPTALYMLHTPLTSRKPTKLPLCPKALEAGYWSFCPYPLVGPRDQKS